MENTMEPLQRTKWKTAIWSLNNFPRAKPEGIQDWNKDTCTPMFIYSQAMKRAKILHNWWMD
jgi:hypothetical protein